MELPFFPLENLSHQKLTDSTGPEKLWILKIRGTLVVL